MNTVITIGRQFGSGGREIGEKLAKHFDIPYYDKELINRVAKDSGFCQEIIESNDERPTSSFLYNLVMDTYSFGYNSSSFIDMPISHKIFLAQFDTIKSIAEEGPCVIVGRCADYALSERDDVLNVFICAREECRIGRILERHPEITSDSKARDMMIKKDKQRQSYYNYYASAKWGHASTYDMTINSSILGIDGTVKLLADFVEDYEKNR
ncbi:MAG: cytidylate kinase-like family protein [Lachnospiraceae bacterium]|nr:cytidylate kinase-like family protein [Lachnospiraceae bacterium]